MSYTALYRKYRPNNFSNVVGQETTKSILINSINNNHIFHAYLFSGPRGTGKTSIAKILAHAVNCENFKDDICNECNTCKFLAENDSDIIEIDAASNNGVDEIRSLRDNVKIMPTFCKYKIYIIDEVHMLSTGAFNALLKTLEEPPSHVIFILATTEVNKIPITILSRCQRYDFKLIDPTQIEDRLNYILNNESLKLNNKVVQYIALNCGGAMRDAINILDQTLSLGKYENTSVEDVENLLGKISKELVIKFFESLINKDYKSVIEMTNEYINNGKNLSDFVNELLNLVRDISINRQIKNYFPGNNFENITQIELLTLEDLLQISKILNELSNEIKNSNNSSVMFEIYMLKIANSININNINVNETKSNNIEHKKDDIKKNIEEVVEVNTLEQESKSKVEVIEKNNDFKNDIKKIRINNVLALANKDELNNIKRKFDEINDFISDKSYNSLVELLNQSEIVVASNKYLLFTFEDESLVSVFDSKYKQIESFLNKIYDTKYLVTSVSKDEWKNIKNKYIEDKKNNIVYKEIEENINNEISKNNIGGLEKTAIDIFGDDKISIK